MKIVQSITFVVSIMAICMSIIFMLKYRDREHTLKIIILMSFALHTAIFYLMLFVAQGNEPVYEFVRAVLQEPQRPFEVWSAALRLHGMLAVLTKEVISFLTKRIYTNGG